MEGVIADIEEAFAEAAEDDPLAAVAAELGAVQSELDEIYRRAFTLDDVELPDGTTRSFQGLDEARMQQLGRSERAAADALLAALRARDSAAFSKFTSEAQKLKLHRSRLQALCADLQGAVDARPTIPVNVEDAAGLGEADPTRAEPVRDIRIVLITGFESFNQRLYRQASRRVRSPAACACLLESHPCTSLDALRRTGVRSGD